MSIFLHDIEGAQWLDAPRSRLLLDGSTVFFDNDGMWVIDSSKKKRTRFIYSTDHDEEAKAIRKHINSPAVPTSDEEQLAYLKHVVNEEPLLKKELVDVRTALVNLFNSSELPARDETLMAAELQLIRLDEVLGC